MRRYACALVMAAAVFVALALPAAASAAAGTTGRTAATATAGAPSPAATGSAGTPAPRAVPAALDIQLWPSEADGVNLVVSAEVPADVELPATVRMPLPEGATLGWVGEVFGGDVSKDIQRQYTLEDGEGGTVVVLTVSESRVVQYEAHMVPLSQAGERYTATLRWVQSAPSAAQAWAVKMVPATGDVQTDPAFAGAPQVNAVGERLYTLPQTQLAVGSPHTLTVSFVRGETSATPTPSAANDGARTVLIVLFSLLAIAVVALAVVAARARRRRT